MYEKTKLKFTQKLKKKRKEKEARNHQEYKRHKKRERNERLGLCLCLVLWFISCSFRFRSFTTQTQHNLSHQIQHNPRQISPTHFLFSLLKSSTTLFQFISDQVHIYIYILRFLVSFSHTLSLVLMHFILILTIMDVNFNVFLDSMQQLKVDTCWMKVKQNQQRFVTIYN